MAAMKPFKLLVLLILLVAIAEIQAQWWNKLSRFGLGGRDEVDHQRKTDPRNEVRAADMSITEIRQEKATEREVERYKELRNRRAVMTDAELQSTMERLKAIYESLPELLSPMDDFYSEDFKRIQNQTILANERRVIEQLSIFAVYRYTKASGNVNKILRNIEKSNPIIQGLPFQDVHLRQITVKPHMLLNESLTQAELIQNYILTKPEEFDKIYRFERPYPGFEENYSHLNTITTFSTFTSCTILKAGFKKGPLITDPNVYKIKFTFSNITNARKIASVSATPEQEEVLFPLGTQFMIRNFTKYGSGPYNDSYSVLLEQYRP